MPDFGVCVSAHGTVTFYLSDDAWLPSYPFAHTRQPYACLNTSSRIYLLFHGIYPTVNPISPSPFLRLKQNWSVLFIHELIVFRDRCACSIRRSKNEKWKAVFTIAKIPSATKDKRYKNCHTIYAFSFVFCLIISDSLPLKKREKLI